MTGLIYVEGHGEVEALTNLVARLWHDLGLPFLAWRPGQRVPNLHIERGIQTACKLARTQNPRALLIVRDDEDGCPRESGPRTATWVRQAQLPFPTAVVMMYREYETLLLPCAHVMAGRPLVGSVGVPRPGLLPGTVWQGDPERIRDAKGWLTDHMPPGRAYKPTLDQLPMTRMLDFDVLRTSGPPCFGTLERALLYIGQNLGVHGVYP